MHLEVAARVLTLGTEKRARPTLTIAGWGSTVLEGSMLGSTCCNEPINSNQCTHIHTCSRQQTDCKRQYHHSPDRLNFNDDSILFHVFQ